MANDHDDPRLNYGRCELDAVAINDVIYDVSVRPQRARSLGGTR